MNADDFKDAVMRAYPAMKAMARRMLRNREDAADALQDAAAALWEHCDRFGTADNPASYAVGVVRNTCLSRLRNSRETLSIDEAADIGDPDDAYAGADADNYLDALISRLPPAQRTVMMMRMEMQLETAAIAEATGFSEANVRQLLSRARRSMRNLYDNKQI